MNHIYILAPTPNDEPAIAYAAREFAHYARKIASARLRVKRMDQYQPGLPGIWLGVSSALADAADPAVEPSNWDDGYQIQQMGDQLLIAGANGRSVLFGVYAYFERLGARWVRPGPRGEWLPQLERLPVEPFDVIERPSYRHRGICIEGAPSIEHALGIVDWMAKRRMNTFFLQFQHAGTFWDRWYARAYNPHYGQPKHLTDDECLALDDRVIAAVKQRGMIVHRVGHGWTAAAVGLRPFGWQTTEEQVAPDKQRWLAELGGKRELFHKTPINTELCYSHPPAFDALIEELVAYAQAHPEVDVLHFWLSDATNNKCECPDCAALSPSDWYARLVNTLSERLYQFDPQRRFVFLSYFESWWPPEKHTIESDRGNVIFMFAPIARCFRHALADETCASDFPLQRPALNHIVMPRDNRTYVQFLDCWWKAFSGDSFVFDYHLIWAVYEQVMDTALGRVLHEDMRSLRQLGLNGMVSCQVLRSFWPTGLAMAAMAETLWNADAAWSDVQRGFFAAAYGDDAPVVEQYLAGLEALLYDAPPHDRGPVLKADQPERARAVAEYVRRGRVALAMLRRAASAPAHRESLSLLLHHGRFLELLCGALLGEVAAEDARAWLLRSERRVHPNLDVPFLMGRHPVLSHE